MGKQITAKPKIGKTRIKSTAQGYFHDLDPYTMHATKQGATQDRSALKAVNTDVKSRDPRESTFYTFMQDPRKNDPVKFGNVPQGPHTFPHHGIHQGLVQGVQQGRLDAFSPLIPTASVFNARAKAEVPDGHSKSGRRDKAMSYFAKNRKKYMALKGIGKKRTRAQTIKYAHTINKLLQIDPFGSYAYKGKGASKKARAGKGESSNKPLANQIDLPKSHGLSDVTGVTTRNQSILNVLKGFGMN